MKQKQKTQNAEIKLAGRTITLTGQTLARYESMAQAQGVNVDAVVLDALKASLRRPITDTLLVDHMPTPNEFAPVWLDGSDSTGFGYRNGELVEMHDGKHRPITLRESVALFLRGHIAEVNGSNGGGCATWNDYARCRWLEEVHAALA